LELDKDHIEWWDLEIVVLLCFVLIERWLILNLQESSKINEGRKEGCSWCLKNEMFRRRNADYELDDRGSISERGRGNFSSLGPIQPLIQWVPGTLSLGVKWPGREADH
jgi:hypothetical protein